MLESVPSLAGPSSATETTRATPSNEVVAMQRGDAGYVHSYTTGSAVDGPGLRFVLWTTGCFFRCQYCHNPDTMKLHNGEYRTFQSVIADIAPYERFLRLANGGVTISGGEPLVQAPFVSRIFQECKQRKIHTALDTNGYLGARLSDADLAAIDLVLLDIKSWDPTTHRRVTGCEVEPVLRFAQRLSDLCKPVWIRFVLVPGLTDAEENIAGLAHFVATLRTVERVEVVPFHQMGAYKWQRLGMPYQLADVAPPDADTVAAVVQQFRDHGCNVG